MKKRLLMVCCVIVFTISFGLLVGCGSKYDKVDDKDLTRWIVKFTSDFPCDWPKDKEGGYSVKYSLSALDEMQLQGNELTLVLPYEEEYAEEAAENIDFTLEPKIDFYYVDDYGREVLLDDLKTEKDYHFMRDILYEVDEEGNTQHSQRVVRVGQYLAEYQFGIGLTLSGEIVQNSIVVGVKIFVQ